MLAFLSGFKIFEHVIMPVRLSLERLIAFQKNLYRWSCRFLVLLETKIKAYFYFQLIFLRFLSQNFIIFFLSF